MKTKGLTFLKNGITTEFCAKLLTDAQRYLKDHCRHPHNDAISTRKITHYKGCPCCEFIPICRSFEKLINMFLPEESEISFSIIQEYRAGHVVLPHTDGGKYNKIVIVNLFGEGMFYLSESPQSLYHSKTR